MKSSRTAYCSAMDRNVPVVMKPGAKLGATPSVRDARILMCLDYGVRCTGAMCPLFTPFLPRRGADPDVRPDAPRPR
jgi:hypothetical protein